jgi:hypothetical protein
VLSATGSEVFENYSGLREFPGILIDSEIRLQLSFSLLECLSIRFPFCSGTAPSAIPTLTLCADRLQKHL